MSHHDGTLAEAARAMIVESLMHFYGGDKAEQRRLLELPLDKLSDEWRESIWTAAKEDEKGKLT